MTHTILCEIDRAGGSLQRLIGLIERRGFDVSSLDLDGPAAAAGIGADARRRIAVGVSSRDADRCVAILGRQIDRLYGVRLVQDPRLTLAGEPA